MLGLDSLGAIALRDSLADQFSLDLPSTIIFDYPTIRSLAHFITPLLLPLRATQGAPESSGTFASLEDIRWPSFPHFIC